MVSAVAWCVRACGSRRAAFAQAMESQAYARPCRRRAYRTVSSQPAASLIAMWLLLPSCCIASEISLDAIFYGHGTDKQSSFHAYVHAYSMILGPWRRHIHSLLEVGIGTVNHSFAANMGKMRNNYKSGASLLSWSEYLPNARIVGLDLDAAAALAIADSTKRIEAYGVDTTNSTSVAALDLTSGGTRPFDVIIDDGLHTWKGQQMTLLSLWPYLRPGGFCAHDDRT